MQIDENILRKYFVLLATLDGYIYMECDRERTKILLHKIFLMKCLRMKITQITVGGVQ